MRKLTMQIVGQRISNMTNGHYKLMSKGTYQNAHQKLEIKHLRPWGHDCLFYKSWNAFKNKPRCPLLYKKANIGRHRKWTKAKVAKFINDKTKGAYKLMLKGQYHNTKQKLPIKHLACGNIFNMTFDKFKRGERCPFCRYNRVRLNKGDVINRINKLDHNSYKCLLKGTYKNANQKLPIKHKKCGHIFYASINELQKGVRCPYCYDPHHLMSKQEIKDGIKKLGHGHYEVAKFPKGNVRSNTKILIKHLVCGHCYYARWNDFQSGHRCPYNHMSHGEATVKEWLDKHNIFYKYGYHTTAYMSKQSKYLHKPLHLDFFLPDLGLAIEVDGIQHFDPDCKLNNYGHNTYYYERKRDSKTNQWCINHHIPLLRIGCWYKSFKKLAKKQTVNTLNSLLLPTINTIRKQEMQTI